MLTQMALRAFVRNGGRFCLSKHQQLLTRNTVSGYALHRKTTASSKSGKDGSQKENDHLKFALFCGVGVSFASCQSEKTNDDEELSEEQTQKDARQNRGANELKGLIREAMILVQSDKAILAEAKYHNCLTLLQKFKDDDSWTPGQLLRATIFVYSMMGNLAFSQEKFEKAESLFKECIKGLIQDGRSQKDDAIVELSLKIAIIRARLGKIEDAEIGYKFCIESQLEKLAEIKDLDNLPPKEVANEKALLGMCLHSYCKFLLELERREEAEEQMRLCLEHAETALPPDHPQRGVLYNDFSQILTAQGKYEESIPYLEKATKLYGSNMDNGAFIHGNLATAYAETGDFTSADKHCKKAQELAKNALYDNTKEAVATMTKMIEIIRRGGKRTHVQ